MSPLQQTTLSGVQRSRQSFRLMPQKWNSVVATVLSVFSGRIIPHLHCRLTKLLRSFELNSSPSSISSKRWTSLIPFEADRSLGSFFHPGSGWFQCSMARWTCPPGHKASSSHYALILSCSIALRAVCAVSFDSRAYISNQVHIVQWIYGKRWLCLLEICWSSEMFLSCNYSVLYVRS